MPNMDSGLTPLQGRVVMHMERLFRMTGTGLKAHARYVKRAIAAELPVKIGLWSDAQCKLGLQLVEESCRDAGLGGFRDIATGWEAL
jgi:hypothetical protein